jgi:hypothetical protein
LSSIDLGEVGLLGPASNRPEASYQFALLSIREMPVLSPDLDRLCATLADARRMLGVGKALIHELANAGNRRHTGMNVSSGSLPGWPPVLNEVLAAAYLSLSPSAFRRAVVPSVPPIHLTPGRVGWLRADLDRWLAIQAGRDAGSSSLHNPWDDD